jgi:hypothetical protein
MVSNVAISDTEQSTTGDKSPAIITSSGNVSINYSESQKENDKTTIEEVTTSFYNDYLKYLNKEFSEQDDSSGFSKPLPKTLGGETDFSKITSAPAYGISKQNLAEYLYGKDQIDHSFAKKIDQMLLKAMQEDPEIGGLEYDPILMAQDIPESIDYDEPDINDRDATITVYTEWNKHNELFKSHKSPIKVVLHKSGKEWRITDIIDPKSEE